MTPRKGGSDLDHSTIPTPLGGAKVSMYYSHIGKMYQYAAIRVPMFTFLCSALTKPSFLGMIEVISLKKLPSGLQPSRSGNK